MENKDPKSLHSNRVAFARLIKQHTFKENKWKAVAHSGLASPWFKEITSVYLGAALIPVKIEVPLSHSAEFFVHFPDAFAPEEKSEIFVERTVFPRLEGADFYLCDLMEAEVQSDLGSLRVVGYFENGDPSRGATAINLRLEYLDKSKEKKLEIEVPLAFLKRKDNSWYLEDVELWVNRE